MNAKEFLQQYGPEKAERIAKKAGTNFPYFSQIAHGHRRASPRLAQRLVLASSGEITLHELRPDIYGQAT